jgi:hypothetical protein
MRVQSLLVASLLACAVVAFAPRARADTFFVTFTSGSTPIGPRTQGAAFDATSTSPAAKKPVKIDIDDWSLLQPTFDACVKSNPLTAKVEFTKPNAQGQEEVYMITTYDGVVFSKMALAYRADATPKATNQLVFSYATSRIEPPPVALRLERPAARELPSSPPVILRKPRAIAAAQRIDDAYFAAPTIPAESPAPPGQLRLLSFAFEAIQPIDAETLLPAGRLLVSTVTMTKAPGAATSAFQAAVASRVPIDAKITFVQHHGTLPDTTSRTVALTKATVTSDGVQVAGTSIETTTLAPMSVAVTGATTTVLNGAGPKP